MVKLGKIKTKKIKAYPKINEEDYVKKICDICDEEFMAQADNVYKCPTCKEQDWCRVCDVVYEESELKVDNEGDYICDSCFVPKCMNCNEEVDEDGQYCSKDCYKEYWAE